MSDVMIDAQDLSKQYGPVRALRNVSFEVRKGQVVGLLGPNGAGKTTAMKILTCFIAPSEGTAKINGRDIFDDPIGVRSAIGYLPENTPLYTEMLTIEYLEFVAKMRGFKGEEAHKRIKRAVELTGLGDVIGKEIRALSKGYRQRTGLAQSLVHEPPILILDEPMTGLDPNQAVGIRDLIKEIGKERTVILSTHNLPEVQVTCDRVLIIAKGNIVADDTTEGLRDRVGKARYQVSLLQKSDGKTFDGAEVRDTLGKISGVEKVEPKGENQGELRFEVLPRSNDDLRPEIFRAAVEKGYVLVGLSQSGENLEDVFRQLTAGQAGDASSADEKRAEDDGEGGDSGDAQDDPDEQSASDGDSSPREQSAVS